jgi:hypothetical protein
MVAEVFARHELSFLAGPLRGDPVHGSDCTCSQRFPKIKSDAALLAGDGLDVRIFDTRQYMFGTASEMNDALHPNAFGQVELSHSVEAVW